MERKNTNMLNYINLLKIFTGGKRKKEDQPYKLREKFTLNN